MHRGIVRRANRMRQYSARIFYAKLGLKMSLKVKRVASVDPHIFTLQQSCPGRPSEMDHLVAF